MSRAHPLVKNTKHMYSYFMDALALSPIAVRTHFSFGRGLLSPQQTLDRAQAHKAAALGLTDWNSLAALPELRRLAHAAGVKLLVGAHLVGGDGELWAWVLHRAGLERLNRLLSRLMDQPQHPVVADLVAEGWRGLRLAVANQAVLERLLSSAWGRGKQGQEVCAALVWGTAWGELWQWARARGLPALAFNLAVWTEPDHCDFYRLLRSIATRVVLSQLAPQECLAETDRWPLPEELERAFRVAPEALTERARLVREAADEELEEPGFVFPRFEGWSDAQAVAYLRQLCAQALPKRYPNGESDLLARVEARLEEELTLIEAKGFASYFLTVHDITSRFPRNCGRGSAAASLVAYLLGITQVDPIRYNLFFERFLNWGRHDPPDIDVDFAWDEREEVLRYVFQKYKGQAALVADHVTFAERSPWREVAQAHGLPEAEIQALIERVEKGHKEDVPDFIRLPAEKLKGMPRYLGTHPGGVVITPGPIYQWAAVHTSAQGWPVLEWEKDGTEEMGLVKIDLLGNRSLAVLRDCFAMVTPPQSWEDFAPYDDEPTIAMLERGDSLGVFYIESPATRLLLKKMGRAGFEELTAASSLIRPAANRYVNLYVQRLRGKRWKPLDPEFERVLAETLGILIYQEDVSRVAVAVAGFSPAEADQLRKVLSKKHKEKVLADFKDRFFRGGAERHKSPEVLNAIWEMMLSFQGYSFTKPHSASYAVLSMKTAWFKCHYPLHFYTAVINNGGGFYTRQVYVNMVLRLGYAILPVEVNASEWRCTVETTASGALALRLGLSLIQEWDVAFAQRLLAERQRGGVFANYADFLVRLRPSLAEIRPLIRSGALDSLAQGRSRPQLFWMHYAAQREGLFPDYLPQPPPCITDYPPAVKLQDELQFLGFFASVFPLNLFRARAQRVYQRGRLPPLVSCSTLPQKNGEWVTLVGMFVTQKPVLARGQKSMAFLSLEDEEGIFELVVFPEVWEKVRDVFARGSAYLVYGKVVVEWGAVIVELQSAVCLNRPQALGPLRRWVYWGHEAELKPRPTQACSWEPR